MGKAMRDGGCKQEEVEQDGEAVEDWKRKWVTGKRKLATGTRK